MVLPAKLSISPVIAQQIFKYKNELSCDESPTISLLVGLSGGVDSVVLLHLLAQLTNEMQISLTAMYIHHGVSEKADEWQLFCQQLCESLNVDFKCERVIIETTNRQSWEAEARKARYSVLFRHANTLQATLVTAHHQDDQLETFLLQLKRGSGLKGLSAMAELQAHGNNKIFRPMLDVPRCDIEAYAKENNLTWVEDESNSNEKYDRNFLRHSIIPVLKNRWPAITKTVSRSAKHCSEAQKLIDEACLTYWPTVSDGNQLNVKSLLTYSESWQCALLRYWFTSQSQDMPSQAQLNEIIKICSAKIDRQPEVAVQGLVIRRYGNRLYMCNGTLEQTWESKFITANAEIDLQPYAQRLNIQFSSPQFEGVLQIVYGELFHKVKPSDKSHSKKISHWLKEWQVPPWMRNSIPVLHLNQSPVAIFMEDKTVYLGAEKQYSQLIVSRY